MKRIILGFVMVIGLGASVGARPHSLKEVKEGYETCLRFLKLSPAAQAAAAKKSGYSLKMVRWGCEYQKRAGLDAIIQGNAEYRYWWRHRNDQQNSGSSGGGSSNDDPNACSRTLDCSSSLYQCIAGHCEEVDGPTPCDNAAHECSPGERCDDGRCQ